MHIFPAMSPIASHRKQTLVINYTDPSGATGTLNFELAAYRALDAQETIAAKKSPATAGSLASGEWWGDTYWKTKRNQAVWDAREAQSAQAAQNAAAAQPGQLATK